MVTSKATAAMLLLVASLSSVVLSSQDVHSTSSSGGIINNAPSSSSSSLFLRSSNRGLQDTTETTTTTTDDGDANADGGKTFFAFLCDENQEEIETDRPIKQGEEIHVCIQRGRSAYLNNLYIFRMNIFEFYKTDIKQRVINNGVVTTNNESRMVGGNCKPGSSICSFITNLKPQFFETDGTVTGIGAVAVQEGNDSTGKGGEFRGVENIQLEFSVEDGYSKNPIESHGFKIKDHWNGIESHIQGLYIAFIIVLILICFCFCVGCILWKSCCADIITYRRRDNDEEEDEAKNQQTIYVTDPIYYKNDKEQQHRRGQAQQKDIDDISETHSLDDDLFCGQ